jgi:putative ABC transport system substrate-binding protein
VAQRQPGRSRHWRINRQGESTGWGTSWSLPGKQTLHLIKAFEEGLRSLGYRVGENVVIEYRFANSELERLPALAADLVRLGVDVIVTGANPNTVAAMKATTTIPIVMTNVSDPVSAGFVANLAHPGGNVTGFALDTGGEILGKRFELLKETLPNLSRVGLAPHFRFWAGLQAPFALLWRS